MNKSSASPIKYALFRLLSLEDRGCTHAYAFPFSALGRLAHTGESARLTERIRDPNQKHEGLISVASAVRESLGGLSDWSVKADTVPRRSGDHSLLSGSWKPMTFLKLDVFGAELHSYGPGENSIVREETLTFTPSSYAKEC